MTACDSSAGQGTLLVDLRDVNAIADALARVLSDGALRDELLVPILA